MPEVEIKISRDGGSVEVDAIGFQGQGCDAVKAAFAAMGSVSEDNKKDEYFMLESERA